jgi:hypothetical protein
LDAAFSGLRRPYTIPEALLSILIDTIVKAFLE